MNQGVLAPPSNSPFPITTPHVRHAISEECGHDPKKLVAYYMKRQRQAQEKKQYREAEPEQET